MTQPLTWTQRASRYKLQAIAERGAPRALTPKQIRRLKQKQRRAGGLALDAAMERALQSGR
jgi:hypothetical protein